MMSGRGLAITALGVLAAACGSRDVKSAGAAQTGAVHEHTAPHGGSLVEFGEEFAHIELVLDSATGVLTAYVLDGEAEQPVRVAHPAILLTLASPAPATVALDAVANPLSGETVGATSVFKATVPSLRSARAFAGTVDSLAVRGGTFAKTQSEYARTPP